MVRLSEDRACRCAHLMHALVYNSAYAKRWCQEHLFGIEIHYEPGASMASMCLRETVDVTIADSCEDQDDTKETLRQDNTDDVLRDIMGPPEEVRGDEPIRQHNDKDKANAKTK